MAREDLHFRLRIPEELKGAIEEAAADNRRSMTAEIVTRLYGSFNFEDDTDEVILQIPRDLRRRILHAANESESDPNLLVVSALEEKFPPPLPRYGELVDMIRKQLETSPPDDPVERAEVEEYLAAAEKLIKLKPHFAQRTITPASMRPPSNAPWSKK